MLCYQEFAPGVDLKKKIPALLSTFSMRILIMLGKKLEGKAVSYYKKDKRNRRRRPYFLNR